MDYDMLSYVMICYDDPQYIGTRWGEYNPNVQLGLS